MAKVVNEASAVNPVRLLESIGVNDFGVDWELRQVLLPRRHFHRVAEYFLGKESPAGCTAVHGGGWLWRLEESWG